MSKSRTDDTPGAYCAPENIVNPATGTGNALQPAAGLANPPYHIHTPAQHIADLGTKLAYRVLTLFTAQSFQQLPDDVLDVTEQLAKQIVSEAESRTQSNE